MNLAEIIEKVVRNQVKTFEGITKYREPLIGYASAEDPLFGDLKETVGEHHLSPKDLLPEAKTVVAFFLPFAKEIIKSNSQGGDVSRDWAIAYIETNKLIGRISEALKDALGTMNIKVTGERATHNFNPENLTSPWSHRSAAFIAGLGTFGINHMLITSAGCGGRFGSVVLSEEVRPTPRHLNELCKYKREGKCLFCVKNCPTGALGEDTFDKFKCYNHVLKVDAQFSDLDVCDVCGKCVVGPCAFQPC